MIPREVISQSTAISVGLAVTLLGAALSFGIVYQRVNELDRRMARVENKLDKVLEKNVVYGKAPVSALSPAY